jgi:hypothetical protein
VPNVVSVSGLSILVLKDLDDIKIKIVNNGYRKRKGKPEWTIQRH